MEEAAGVVQRAARRNHHLVVFCSQTILIKAGSSDSQTSLFRRTSRDVNIPLAPSLTNQESPVEGHRKQRRLLHYNSLPVFFLPLIHPLSTQLSLPPCFHSPHFFSSLLSLSLPDSFSSYDFRTSSFPFSSPSSHPVCVSVLPLSLSSLFLHPSLSHSAFTILFLFSCEVCPVSHLPHQRDRTMGPIFSPGLSPLIRVPARFFPMAEHKTGSLLLGTNPLHPGLSNGLEGAMRLTVYPLQLERSFLSFSFHRRHLSV